MDITKCRGVGCNLRFGCHRFKSIPDEHMQSYFTSPPFTEHNNIQICGYFWPTEEYLKLERDAGKDSRQGME